MNVDKYRAAANQLVRNPDDPEALVSQYANIAEKLENGKYYLPLAKRAYEIAPQEISALFNYASALHRNGNFEQALKLYLKGLPRVGDDWKARFLHHVGIAYRALNENGKACEYYRQAYEATGDIDILKDAAIATMASGDLQAGFKMFEIRKECAARKFERQGGKLVSQQKLPKDVVYWEGQDLTDKTVVVYHEEGQGDFIQFCRYIPKLREQYGAAKILLCGPGDGLLDLVADNIRVDGIVPLGGPFSCDYVVGSMSIPWRVGVDLGRVDGRPYFKADQAQLPKRGKLNVGLVWQGNPEYGMDVHRSIAFSEYCQLFDIPGVAFYSLQKGSIDPSLLGYDGFVANLDAFMSSWSDTARIVQALDVVVSVDTAVAHLAGALGKPVFILTTNASDWRWNRNSRKTAWYDSATVIRQKQQDEWAPCIEAVRHGLKWHLEHDRRRSAA